MNVGDTFRGGDLNAGAGDRGHLCVVMLEVGLRVAIVNFTDYEDAFDKTVRVEANEHSWLTKPSAIAFEYLWDTTLAALEAGVIKGEYVPYRDRVSHRLLVRILRGAIVSDNVPGWVKKGARDVLDKLGHEEEANAGT